MNDTMVSMGLTAANEASFSFNWFFLLLVVLITAGYMFWLYRLSQLKSGSTVPFYSLLFIPRFLPALLFLIALIATSSFNILFFLLFSLYVIWSLLWGRSLYEVASEGNAWWFIFIFLVEPFFIVYMLTSR